MLVVGAPMVAMIGEIGGARARTALTAISMIERGALGNYAAEIALSLPGAQKPAWSEGIRTARLARARTERSPGDGEAILLDLERSGRHDLSVAVFIDDRLDGAVKWIRLLGPVPAVPGADDANPGARMEPADLGEVADRVLAGIEVADRTPRPGTAPELADLRAFLLARVLDVADATAGSCTPR